MSTATTTAPAKKPLPNEGRPGYKHTKLGWIPEEWGIERIRHLGSIITGSTPNTSNREYYGSDYMFIGPGDLGSKYTTHAEKGLSEHGWSEVRQLPKGAVLCTCIGSTIGKMSLASEALATNQQINAVVTSERNEAEFVYYALHRIAPRMRQLAGEQAVPMMNKSDFGQLEIIHPPLPEQRRIAAVLGAWDQAIATVQQLLAAQQQRKRGLMQELLTGRRRFPGFKKKWKNVRMGELFERVIRKNEVGDTHVMTISAQHGLIDQREIFNKSVAGANLAGYYLLKRGEFAYNKSSSNGYPFGAIKRLERYEQGILSVLYICFRLKSGAGSGDYFTAYFDAGLMDKGIRMIAQEGARNHGLLNVSTTDFFDIDLHIPDEDEQAVIAKAVGALNKETDAIQNYLDHLATQKRGLMQVLLTGEKRLKS